MLNELPTETPAELLERDAADPHVPEQVSRGFWGEAWQRFRQRKLQMMSLAFVMFLGIVALTAPMIAGTKPIVCKYKGSIYFPAMGYYVRSWENPIFRKERFRNIYPKNLKKKDPESWAVWPLVYQDPYRRVRKNEWVDENGEGRPGNPSGTKGSPSSLNWFGTNQQGFDVFAQMVHGTQIALSVGFVSMGIAASIGIFIGALAGYLGGWIDILLSRLIEVVMCVPSLVLILALVAMLDNVTNWHLMAIVGCTSWTGIARLTRAEFLKLKQMEFITAARALGANRWRIMFRHVLRNALAPVLVPITFGIAAAILIESGLSYLGFGASPPNPSWGTLLKSGRTAIQQMWWLIVFPGTAIFLTVLAYNLIGEGLQEATDPRLRQDSH
ncbi:ABC transporter permease [Adhaeretor mobilis]|uniref:Putative D,D-dipeptide transport system permease protein DdpC n=1 Tax=Adhaeretor mobilis TaxID=1930276 RepID=A0A517N301_9BACT|nr:ABC transporter permease [Adhaeretor mobilis]QDT01378.1 putative D,D-dipeptide transport system permease protein DdpC [Adhaeretor mobilis]